MFGIDVLNSVPISHLLMTENHVFNATSLDIEPTDGSGDYNDAKWNESTGSYMIQYVGEGGRKNSGMTNAAELTTWLTTVLAKSKGQGIKFSELSPADAEIEAASTGGSGTGSGTAKDCSLENREAVAGDTTTCGSCLSGYVEDETGVCVAVASGTDETEIVSNDSSSKKILGALAVFGTIGSVMVYMANKA
jgi:hypothetical protein